MLSSWRLDVGRIMSCQQVKSRLVESRTDKGAYAAVDKQGVGMRFTRVTMNGLSGTI